MNLLSHVTTLVPDCRTMRVLTRFISTFVVFFSASLLYAQNEELYKPDKVIPPSPTAASLGNFGNNSPGSYNGLPAITVPVYQFRAAGQKFDISLSYDASGVKPLPNASWAGLGWSLSYGGGAITRTVRGQDDLRQPNGYHYKGALPNAAIYSYLYASNFLQNDDYWFFQGARQGTYDAEPDIFTYSFGENSGRFLFDKTVNGSKILELDRTNLKITYSEQNGWKIVDGNGFSYYFNTKETSEDYSYTNYVGVELFDGAPIGSFTDQNIDRAPIVTSWYLDAIESPSGEMITFEYLNGESLSVTNKYEQVFNTLQTQGGCQGDGSTTNTGFPSEQRVYGANKQIIADKILHRIVFDNGSIEFNTTNRDDVESRFNIAKRLDHILVKDKQNNLLKKFVLYHTYFTDNNGESKKLKLDAVKEFAGTGEELPAWQFTYFNPGLLPYKFTKAIDHWGYFNNRVENTTLLPYMFKQLPNGTWRTLPGANRLPDVNVDALRNGVLSSVTYPTGGKTNFDYELNEYTNLYGDDQYDAQNTNLVIQSGLWGFPNNQSDQQINLTLTETREVTFRFNYYNHNDPFLLDEFIPDYAFLEVNGQPYHTFDNHPPGPGVPYFEFENLVLSPGTYTMKVRALNGYATRLEAIWVQRTPVTQRKGGGLRIKRIENIDNAGTVNVKKFQYNIGTQPTGLLLNPVKYDYDVSLQNGLFHWDGGSSYYCSFTGTVLSRNSSSVRTEGFSVKGGVIGYSKVTEVLGENGENGKIDYYFHNVANILEPNVFPSLPINGDILNGKLDSMIMYNAAGQPVKKTEYTYTTKQMDAMDGVKLMPLPFSADNFQIVYYNNVSAWIVATTTKETEYLAGGPVVTIVNDFYDNMDHKQLTKKEQLRSNNTLMTQQFRYPHDLQSSGTPNVYNTMVTRNMLNPVVEQSSYSNTTNFLQSTKNNFDYWSNNAWGGAATGQVLLHTVDSKVLTNNTETRLRFHSYDDKGNVTAVAKENDVAKIYIWGYNNTFPVAEVTGASYSAVIAVLNQSILQNPSGDQALRDELNKIRQHFPSALVTTYTYKPLVGMTSQTDAGNHTTYFEYDMFCRLKLIRDIDGNVIKAFDYKYQVQP